jgi:hypothetical protein
MSYIKLVIAMTIARYFWSKRKMILSGLITLSLMTSNAFKNPEKFLKSSIARTQRINTQVIKLAHWGCKNVYGKKFLGIKVYTPYICKKGKQNE